MGWVSSEGGYISPGGNFGQGEKETGTGVVTSRHTFVLSDLLQITIHLQ